MGAEMSDNVFLDKQPKPEDRALARALGKTFDLWVEIRDSVGTEHGPVVEEWKYYGAKYGWTLKTLRQKRNLFFFTPCQGYFRISFAFGDKAVAAMETSGLPAAMIAGIKNTKKYAEGRGLRIEVKTRRDVEHVKKLIAIKVAN
jgi:hypothetical protein